MNHTPRCDWCGDDPLYVSYHDREWGVPVADPLELFERLVLEGMQAGLSWYTVLKKRPRMQECFFGFDPSLIDRRGDAELPCWLEDPGLIRHRGKLEALIGNARAYLRLSEPFADWIWSFVGGVPCDHGFTSSSQVPAQTEESRAMSRALKQAGFRFVGPTICYAFMQSAGLVNDHLTTCHRYQACQTLGTAWGS